MYCRYPYLSKFRPLQRILRQRLKSKQWLNKSPLVFKALEFNWNDVVRPERAINLIPTKHQWIRQHLWKCGSMILKTDKILHETVGAIKGWIFFTLLLLFLAKFFFFKYGVSQYCMLFICSYIYSTYDLVSNNQLILLF